MIIKPIKNKNLPNLSCLLSYRLNTAVTLFPLSNHLILLYMCTAPISVLKRKNKQTKQNKIKTCMFRL